MIGRRNCTGCATAGRMATSGHIRSCYGRMHSIAPQTLLLFGAGTVNSSAPPFAGKKSVTFTGIAWTNTS